MNPPPDDAPEPVLLIIADISGYTRYMTAHAKSLAHGQAIITALVTDIIKQVELPLEVAKLEGDAIFLVCRKQNCAPPWLETRNIIAGKLLAFFGRFGEKISELSRSTTCTCQACTHIEKLRLKVMVHSGEALFHRVLSFVELAGVDVIIVHRLLKNSIQAEQYLLLTKAAAADLEFPVQLPWAESAETYPDIGRVNTFVYLPAGEESPARASRPAPFSERLRQSGKLYGKLWFAPLCSHSGPFRNLTNPGSGRRIGFALFTILFTPLFLPVGGIFVFLHACKSPQKKPHDIGCHERHPDGSCCHK